MTIVSSFSILSYGQIPLVPQYTRLRGVMVECCGISGEPDTGCVCNNAILYLSVCRCCCLCFSMAVVIRLLGLRITAGSEDIRKFFSGLKIPDGGVHIIGGERDEAFIIFASDEDARRAMTRSGGCIKGTPVNLLLSSKSEMQNILEASTKKTDLNQQRPHKEEFRRRESEATDPSFSEKLSMEKQRAIPEMGNRFVQDPHGEAHIQNRKSESNSVGDLFLFLKGMPFSVTEDEVRHFFQGLIIDAMILMKNHRGQNNGKGIVKFRTRQDAREGMKRDREYIGSRFVELYPTTEEEWINANGAMAANADEFTHKYRKGSPPHIGRDILKNVQGHALLWATH